MTRAKPTEAEVIIREAVHLHFGSELAFVPRPIEDNPDLLFKLGSKTIACELTQIPSSELIRYNHYTGQTALDKTVANGVEVIWADEPHMWMAEAIRRKRGKISEYKRNTEANQVWLLAHAPATIHQTYIRGDEAWEMQMLRYAAASEAHGFDRVYFWEPKTGLQRIHRRGQSGRRVQFDFSNGYPARFMRLFHSGEITTTSEGDDPVEYDFGEVELERIVIPPQDPEFRKHPPNKKPKNVRMRAVAYSDRIEPQIEVLDQPSQKK